MKEIENLMKEIETARQAGKPVLLHSEYCHGSDGSYRVWFVPKGTPQLHHPQWDDEEETPCREEYILAGWGASPSYANQAYHEEWYEPTEVGLAEAIEWVSDKCSR